MNLREANALLHAALVGGYFDEAALARRRGERSGELRHARAAT